MSGTVSTIIVLAAGSALTTLGIVIQQILTARTETARRKADLIERRRDEKRTAYLGRLRAAAEFLIASSMASSTLGPDEAETTTRTNHMTSLSVAAFEAELVSTDPPAMAKAIWCSRLRVVVRFGPKCSAERAH